jgi:sialidase-1
MRLVGWMLGLWWVLGRLVGAQEPPPNAAAPQAPRVVEALFLGDSNTYAGDYVAMFEAASLVAGQRLEHVPVGDGLGDAGWLNLGLPSETLSGLSEPGHAGGSFPRPDLHERLERILARVKPRVVYACYGMNCGIYHPYSDERFLAFQRGVRSLAERVKAAGARLVMVTPPLFDLGPIQERTLPRDAAQFDRPYRGYDEVLELYSSWLTAATAEGKWEVVNPRPGLHELLRARRAVEPTFTVTPDGVHLNEQGHWLVARAILRAAGLPELDLNSDTFQDAFPDGLEVVELLKLIRQRQRLLTDSYLTAIGHLRPGMAQGVDTIEAERTAKELDQKIAELVRSIRSQLQSRLEPVVVCRDAGAGGYEAFPDVCRLRDGRLLCVFYAGYGHVALPNSSLPQGGRIACCYSSDEGHTWSPAETVYDGPDDDRDPSVVQLADGRLLLSFFSLRKSEASPGYSGLGSWLIESADGGKTWSEPRQLSASHYCSAPIRQLSNGRLIVGLYIQTEGVSQGSISFSDDGGKSWQPEVLIDNGGMKLDAETDLIELRDGSLFAAQRPVLASSRSTDGGVSWTVSERMGFEGHCPYFLRTAGDVIVLAYRLPHTSLRYSRDECVTWSENHVVDEVTGAYPSLVNLRDGSVLIVYYEEGSGSNIRARRFRIDREGLKWLPLRD